LAAATVAARSQDPQVLLRTAIAYANIGLKERARHTIETAVEHGLSPESIDDIEPLASIMHLSH
jgi:hypothetical protein